MPSPLAQSKKVPDLMVEVVRAVTFLQAAHDFIPSAKHRDRQVARAAAKDFIEGEGKEICCHACATVVAEGGGKIASRTGALEKALIRAASYHAQAIPPLTPPIRLSNFLYAVASHWVALSLASANQERESMTKTSTVIESTLHQAGLLLKATKRLPVNFGDAVTGRPLSAPLSREAQVDAYKLSMPPAFAATSPRPGRILPPNVTAIRNAPSRLYTSFLAHSIDRAALEVATKTQLPFKAIRAELVKVIGFWTKIHYEQVDKKAPLEGLRAVLDAGVARWIARRTNANFELANIDVRDIALALHGADIGTDLGETIDFIRSHQRERKSLRYSASRAEGEDVEEKDVEDPIAPRGPVLDVLSKTLTFDAVAVILKYIDGTYEITDLASARNLLLAFTFLNRSELPAIAAEVQQAKGGVDVHGILKSACDAIEGFEKDPCLVSISKLFRLLEYIAPLRTIPGYPQELGPIELLRQANVDPAIVETIAVFDRIRAILVAEPAVEKGKMMRFLEVHRDLLLKTHDKFDEDYVAAAAVLVRLQQNKSTYRLPAPSELGPHVKELVREEGAATHKRPGTWEARLVLAKDFDAHLAEALFVARALGTRVADRELTHHLIIFAKRYSPDFSRPGGAVTRQKALELLIAAEKGKYLSAAKVRQLLELEDGPRSSSRAARSDFISGLLKASAISNPAKIPDRCDEPIFGLHKLLDAAVADCDPSGTRGRGGITRSSNQLTNVLHMHAPSCGRRVTAYDTRLDHVSRRPVFANIMATFDPKALVGTFGFKGNTQRVAVLFTPSVEDAINDFAKESYPKLGKFVRFTEACEAVACIPAVLVTGMKEVRNIDRLKLLLERDLIHDLSLLTRSNAVPNFIIRVGDGYALLNLQTITYGTIDDAETRQLLRAASGREKLT